jgi:hypothetical protein
MYTEVGKFCPRVGSFKPGFNFFPGANPTIASYNASVVKTYSAVNSMARF